MKHISTFLQVAIHLTEILHTEKLRLRTVFSSEIVQRNKTVIYTKSHFGFEHNLNSEEMNLTDQIYHASKAVAMLMYWPDLLCIKSCCHVNVSLATPPTSADPGTPRLRQNAARAPPGREAGTVPHCVQGTTAGADYCQDQEEDWPRVWGRKWRGRGGGAVCSFFSLLTHPSPINFFFFFQPTSELHFWHLVWCIFLTLIQLGDIWQA